MDIDDFAERMGVHLPEGPYATVGGYIRALSERAPEPGMQMDAEGLRFTITALDGDRITELRITLTPADATEEVPAEDTP